MEPYLGGRNYIAIMKLMHFSMEPSGLQGQVSKIPVIARYFYYQLVVAIRP